jgi:hypothetical protein
MLLRSNLCSFREGIEVRSPHFGGARETGGSSKNTVVPTSPGSDSLEWNDAAIDHSKNMCQSENWVMQSPTS